MIQFFSKAKSAKLKSKTLEECTPIFHFSVTYHMDEHKVELVNKEENNIKNFMFSYTNTMFHDPNNLTFEQKSNFGKYTQSESGQTWFATMINLQRTKCKCVSETTFFSLVQHFAIVLFECSNCDHFSPAKNLMNMCFTFYHEIKVPGCEPHREYLSSYLKNQQIWKNIRFWNAAFFDAVQLVRLQKPLLTKKKIVEGNINTVLDEEKYQKNITFGQLGTFICTMHAFDLERNVCEEFLQKQIILASLPPNQEKVLKEHMNNLYKYTRI